MPLTEKQNQIITDLLNEFSIVNKSVANTSKAENLINSIESELANRELSKAKNKASKAIVYALYKADVDKLIADYGIVLSKYGIEITPSSTGHNIRRLSSSRCMSIQWCVKYIYNSVERYEECIYEGLRYKDAYAYATYYPDFESLIKKLIL